MCQKYYAVKIWSLFILQYIYVSFSRHNIILQNPVVQGYFTYPFGFYSASIIHMESYDAGGE